MRSVLAVLGMVALVACGPRQVNVDTGTPESAVSLSVTNNASQSVNVYVVSGGSPIFVGQVSPGSTQQLSVSGVAVGSIVTLRATTTDGTRTYSKDNVPLNGSVSWQVP
jgi:hypothetical protein